MMVEEFPWPTFEETRKDLVLLVHELLVKAYWRTWSIRLGLANNGATFMHIHIYQILSIL